MKHLRKLERSTIEEFVRWREFPGGAEEFLHEDCYQLAKMLPPVARKKNFGEFPWVELMVNNYLRNKFCKYCGKPLQCSCSPFRARPNDGICYHERIREVPTIKKSI